VIATVLIGLLVLYTSHVLWRYCMAHPDSQDIVDLSTRLFPLKYRKAAYIVVSIMFLLNNLFVMALHVLSGSVALNTLSDHSICTVYFGLIMTIIMLSLSLFRELNQVAIIGFIAAGTMFIAFLLTLIFLGVDGKPPGYAPGLPFTITAWSKPGTTFTAGFNAVLNIMYTYVGQALIPTYVADMKKPEDFPKALYLCTFCEVVLFTIGGAVGYHFIGDEYMVSPCYGALSDTFVKVVAAFTLPTLIAVGVLYSSITSRFVFLRIFKEDSVHRLEHTVKGWATWIGIVICGYAIAFVIGEAIPFFNELLSLMSSLFDWWFGFALEGVAFFSLYKKGMRWTSPTRIAESMFNILVICIGLFILVGGCYSSIDAIKADYQSGKVAGAFSCENNGF